MSSFVKVKKEDIEQAVANFSKAYSEAKEAYDKAIAQAKIDVVKVRSWIFFKKDISVYEDYVCNYWFWEPYFQSKYKDIISIEQMAIVSKGNDYLDNLCVFLQANPNEIYLDSVDTAKMVTWRDVNND